MNAFRGKSLSIVITLLLAVTFRANATGVRVIEDSPQGTLLEFTFSDWSVRATEEGGVMVAPSGVSADNRQGGPITPYIYQLIGVPNSQKPTVTVEDIVWGERIGQLPTEGTEQEEIIPFDHLSGLGLFTVSDPVRWRGRWISHLYVMPQNMDGSGVRPIKSMRVRIKYASRSAERIARSDSFAKSVIANPGAAANWGAAKTKSLRSVKSVSATNEEIEDLYSSGTMVRIEITSEGIYQISRSQIENLGIELTGIDPRDIRMFGNGGQVLSESISAARDTTLIENAILIEGEEDGSFDSSDRILFYGRSVKTWLPSATAGEYDHTNNPFTRANVYYLYIPYAGGDDGLRMAELDTDLTATSVATTARAHSYVESDAVIFATSKIETSGKNWYATYLSTGDQYATTVQADAPVTTSGATLELDMLSYGGTAQYIVSFNGTPIDTVLNSSSTNTVEVPAGLIREGGNTIGLRITGKSIYVDWIELSYERELTTDGSRLEFDKLPSDGPVRVELDGLDSPYVFNIQEFDAVKMTRNVPFVVESQSNSPDRFLAVEESSFLTPGTMKIDGLGGSEYTGSLRDPSLSADYLILTHSDFIQAVAPLEAFIELRDTIEVMTIDVEDIYRDFSWGVFDPTAIRDFLYYATYNWSKAPETVFLVGDGNYDYRNILNHGEENWVPAYESGEQCSDDFYAKFESGIPEIVLGRLPARSSAQVETYVEKLIQYETNLEDQPWRGRMILVADDEYQDTGVTSWDSTHLRETETFAKTESLSYLEFKKFYLSLYNTELDPSTGARTKPDLTDDLIEALNEGALIVQYIGHGNAHVWTHENVLMDTRDDALIDTGDRPPIFLAATCSWGHWDRADNISHPERLLVRDGGAIAVVAASRLTYASANEVFGKNMREAFFDRTKRYRLGESVLIGKLANGSSSAYSYHCLGDPRLRPALPYRFVSMADLAPDSLTAFSGAQVSGTVMTDGITDPSWDGEVLVDVIGSMDTLSYTFKTLSAGEVVDGSELKYVKPSGRIFRGFVSADAGEFDANFIVPRDVKLGTDQALVRMYAFSDGEDGAGYASKLPISTDVASLNDATPPEINVYFDQEGWIDGDMTSTSPTLYVDLFDTNGINLTGDIGHDILAIIDGETEIRLTDDFVYERDSYSRGTASRKLYNLTTGNHTLELWAWDIANNYGFEEVTFQVASADGVIVLNDVMNYPNPFSDETQFTFELSAVADVTIKIFTASGRLVHQIGPISAQAGFNYPGSTSSELRWNGQDRYGDPIANGVYLYKVTAVGENRTSDEVIGKLLRIR